MSVNRLIVCVLAGLAATVAVRADAQPLGSFRWQLRPYCNIVTLAVTQQGGQYQLDGFDDQCNVGAVYASVRGMAYQNPNGTIGFGMSIVTAPGGAPVHIDATISISTLSGTWRDSAGNSGTFVYTPGAGIGGGPRPVPSGGLAPGSVTNVQIAAGAVGTTQLAANAVTGANVADGSLTSADILGAPTSASVSGDSSVTLTATPAVVRTVTLAIPVAGAVIVNASGYFKLNSLGDDTGRCIITTGTAVDFTHLIVADDAGNVASTAFVPFGATRRFVVAPGSFTVNLVCDINSGAVDVRDTSLTAFFVAG